MTSHHLRADDHSSNAHIHHTRYQTPDSNPLRIGLYLHFVGKEIDAAIVRGDGDDAPSLLLDEPSRAQAGGPHHKAALLLAALPAVAADGHAAGSPELQRRLPAQSGVLVVVEDPGGGGAGGAAESGHGHGDGYGVQAR